MRRDSICLIPSLVLSVALLGGCKSNAERADELYASALTASAPSEAIALLQEAIGLNPRLEGAHRELANVQFGQANFPAAIDAASAALALQETAEARAIRGQSHFAQESWEPARADLQRAQEIDMTRTDLMMPLGVAHRELGQTEAALGMFERLLEADPDDRAAALEIAEIELDQATELVAPEELNEEIRTQVRSLLTHASTLAPESIVGPGEAVADAERWVFEGEPGSPARARWTAIEESLRTLEETLAARDAALAVREPETDPPRLSRNRQEIQRVAGILAQLSDQRQSGVFADSLHGTGAALGAVGDGFGLGTTGTGVGGGGTSEGVIGLGNVGLIGSGMGPTNPVPQIRGGQVGVRGSLDRAVVQRVIRRHMNELRYCYQRQLANNPSLQGRVELNFTIGPTGSVTAASAQGMSGVDECMARAVRRWTFPAPNGGGVVLVRYPLHLSS